LSNKSFIATIKVNGKVTKREKRGGREGERERERERKREREEWGEGGLHETA